MITIFAPGLTVEVFDQSPPPDTTPPDTFIASGPSDSQATSVTFTFTATDDQPGPLTFQGSLDGGSWMPVISPWTVTGLAVGAHQAGIHATDAAGNADPTPAVFFWNVLAASGAMPILTRKSPANSQTVYGPYNFRFCIGTVMPGGKVHLVWDGTNEFDAVTGAWALKAVSMADGSPAPTRPENFGQCWVPGEAVVYQGTQAPGGVFNRFDPVTGVYTNIPASQGATYGDSCLLYDAPRNRLLSFGGFVSSPTTLRAMGLPNGNWSTIQTAGAPPITFDYSKLTLYRAAISSQGRIGVLADNNVIYELDGGATAWTERATTGVLPPIYSHFVYYEPADAYFAWCGINVVADSATPVVGKFYAVRRATWVWEEITVQQTVAPRPRSMVGSILLADSEREQLLLFGAAGYTELFALDLRGWP